MRYSGLGPLLGSGVGVQAGLRGAGEASAWAT